MAINFQQVNFSYGAGTSLEQPILFDITANFPTGQVTAVVGQTGSGKSTLIQHINGLLLPTEGQVTVADHRITANTKEKELMRIREKVGMVFQFPENQLFANTVLEDVMYGPINFGYSRSDAKNAAEIALKRLNVSETLWEKSPFELSGGQMRRIAIAGALASNPDIVVLDEPAAGLDPRGQQELLNLVIELKSLNKTVILISHQMDHVAQIADQVIVMHEGKVAAQEAPEQLFNRDIQWFTDMKLDLPKAGQFAEKLRQQDWQFEQRPLTIKALTDLINSRGTTHG